MNKVRIKRAEISCVFFSSLCLGKKCKWQRRKYSKKKSTCFLFEKPRAVSMPHHHRHCCYSCTSASNKMSRVRIVAVYVSAKNRRVVLRIVNGFLLALGATAKPKNNCRWAVLVCNIGLLEMQPIVTVYSLFRTLCTRSRIICFAPHVHTHTHPFSDTGKTLYLLHCRTALSRRKAPTLGTEASTEFEMCYYYIRKME